MLCQGCSSCMPEAGTRAWDPTRHPAGTLASSLVISEALQRCIGHQRWGLPHLCRCLVGSPALQKMVLAAVSRAAVNSRRCGLRCGKAFVDLQQHENGMQIMLQISALPFVSHCTGQPVSPGKVCVQDMCLGGLYVGANF